MHEPSKINIKPTSEPTAPSSEPRLAPLVVGSAPSEELRAGPSAERKAGPVPSSIPAPAAPPMTNDQGPRTKEKAQQRRFDALPRSIRGEIEYMRSQLWLHNGRPHLSKESVNEFLAFIDKHLGEDSIGPESCARERRQEP